MGVLGGRVLEGLSHCLSTSSFPGGRHCIDYRRVGTPSAHHERRRSGPTRALGPRRLLRLRCSGRRSASRAGHDAGGVPLADRKSFWAWCLESEEPSDADRAALAAKLSKRYGVEVTAKPVPSLDDAELRAPRIAVPDSVAGWCSTTTYDRARYAYGAHFTERVRAFNLDFDNPPDVVAHPRDETEVEATLDWCDANGYVTVPYGGGSSVVWGVTPHDDLGPTVVISLDRLDRVLEID
ncbi:MAG: FAD-binding oxidoreductase, partial [Acidimicrobiaceae bacterium]|nr:FAD-binding oxidoreductase [Acidimicrobiaceae bacterium]